MLCLVWNGKYWRAIGKRNYNFPQGTMICFPWDNWCREPSLHQSLRDKLAGIPLALRMSKELTGRVDVERAGIVFRSQHSIYPTFVRDLGEAITRLVIEALLGFPVRSSEDASWVVTPATSLQDFVRYLYPDVYEDD